MPNFSDALSGYTSVPEAKKAEVAAVSEAKKATLNAFDTYNQGGQSAFDQMIEENRQAEEAAWADRTNRSAGQLAKDLPLSVLRTGVGLVGGTAALIAKYNPVAPNLPGQEDDRFRDAAAAAIAGGTGKIDLFLRSGQSDISNINEEAVNRRIAEDGELARAAMQDKIDRGINPTVANIERFGEGVVSGFKRTVQNPTTLLDQGTGQVATLFLGPLGRAGTVARATTAVEKKLAQEAAGVGGSASAQALMSSNPARFAKEISDLAEGKARNQFAGVVGATEAGDAFGGAVDRVMNIPLSDLQSTEEYQKIAIDHPEFTELDIRRRLGTDAGGIAALIAGPIGAVSGRLAASFELNPLKTGASATKAGGAVMNVLKESGEEFVQGAGGALAQNLGLKESGAIPDQDVMDGVGSAAGSSVAVAGAMAGGLQSVATLREGLGLAADGTKGYLKAAAAKSQLEAEHATVADNEVVAGRMREIIAARAAEGSLTPGLASLDTEAPPSVNQASLPDSARVDAAPGGDPVRAKLNQLTVYSSRIENEKDPNVAFTMGTEVVERVKEFRSVLTEIDSELAKLNPASEQHQKLSAIRDDINSAVNNDRVLKQMESFGKLTDVQRTALEDALDDEAHPNHAQAIEQVRAMIYAAPDKVTPNMAKGPLNQKKIQLTEEERNMFNIAIEQGQLYEAAAAEQNALVDAVVTQAKDGSKSVTSVRKNIQDQGAFGKLGLKGHVVGIQKALAQKDFEYASKLATDFQKFASHLRTRAAAFAETKAKLLAGTVNSLSVPGTQTWDPTKGKLVDTEFKLHKNSPTSMIVGDAVQIDARAAVQSYNNLIKRMPKDSGFKPLVKSGEVVSTDAPATPAAVAPSPAAPSPAAEASVATASEEEDNEPDYNKLFPIAENAAYFDLPSEVKEEFRRLDSDIGWSLVGGKIIREGDLEDAPDGQRASGDVVGRTEWVGKPGPNGQISTFWSDRPRDKNGKFTVNEKVARKLLYQYSKGLFRAKANNVNQQEFLEYARKHARAIAIERVEDTMLALSQEAAQEEAADTTPQETVEQAEVVAVEEEAAPQVHTTIAERFPTLVDQPKTLPTNATKIDRLANTNQLIQGFNLKKSAMSLLARLGDNPAAQLLELAKKGAEGLMSLMPKNSQAFFTTDDITWTKRFAEEIPKLVEDLNKLLTDRDPERKSINAVDAVLAWEKNPTRAAWVNADKYSLMATNVDPNNLKYDDNIAQAMIIAGMRWAMDNVNRGYPAEREQVADFFNVNEQDVTREMFAAFQKGRIQEAFLSDMAREVQMELGISGKNDTSINFTDGLMKSLAADMMEVFLRRGYMKQTPYTFDEGVDKNGKDLDVRFNTLSFIEGSAVELARKAAGSSWNKFKTMFNPESSHEWYIGAPPSTIDKLIQGTLQLLSKDQLKGIRNHQAVKFTLNKAMFDQLIAMGEAAVKEQMGYTIIELADDGTPLINDVDAVRVDGINKGINRAWQSMLSMHAELEAHSKQTGLAIDEIPVHFDWYQSTNGRMMMRNPAGPQGNKLMREILTPVKATMTLANPQHVEEYKLAIAQALGFKVENETNAAAVAQVDAWFNDEGHPYSEVIQAITKPGAKPNEIALALRAAGKLEVRGTNALLTHARFLQALENGDTEFTQDMAFELDGKTDGPVNAIGQFGIWQVDTQVLEHLARGGYFFGNGEGATLNTYRTEKGEKQGDLYGKVAQTFQGMFVSKLSSLLADSNTLKKTKKKADTAKDALMIGMFAGKAIFEMLGQITTDTEGNITVLRGFTKQPITSTGYGGGLSAIAGHLVSETLEHLYKELTRGMNEQQPISPLLADAINSMITTKVWTYMGEVKSKRVADAIDFADHTKYGKIELSPMQLVALKSQMENGLGSILTDAITAELGSTLTGMQNVIKSSQIQWTALAFEYEREYEKLRLQRVGEGKLLPRQGLSRADENEIIDRLENMQPIFQTAYTEADQTRDSGLAMLESTRGGKLVVNEKVQQVRSILSKLSSDINKTRFENPGVRAAALFNIGVGDSNMMANFFKDMAQALNVWDGLEIAVGQVKKTAPKINEAVYKSWQYDAIGAVNQNFQRSLSSIKKAMAANPDLAAAIKAVILGPLESESNAEELLDQSAGTLNYMAVRTKITKEVMGELGTSMDHMAGAMTPYIKNGEVVPMSELALWINKRVVERMADKGLEFNQAGNAVFGQPNAVEPADPKLTEMAAAHDNVLNHTAILQLGNNFEFKSKVQEYVWSKVSKLLPKSTMMYVGTAEEVAAKQAELFPDVAFNDSHGSYYASTIFLVGASPETLVHEVLHAATYGLLQQYYTDKSALNADQVAAIADLELMTREFVGLNTSTESAVVENTVRSVQREIGSLLIEGNMAAAVNEFMAWTVNENVQTVLGRKIPRKIGKLFKRVLGAVRKLFGLGNNEQVNTWLAQALSSITRLADSTRTAPASVDQGLPLFQSLGTSSGSEHAAHVERVFIEYTQKVETAARLHMLSNTPVIKPVDINAVLQGFKNAGFNFAQREEFAFLSIQLAMSAGIKHDPRALALTQKFYEHVVKKLTAQDFMADPTSLLDADIKEGQDKLNALLGDGTQAKNSEGQSNLLANFVSLGLIDESFRKVLKGIEMPAKKGLGNNPNEWVRSLATRVFDWFGTYGMKSEQADVLSALDQLSPRIVLLEKEVARSRVPDVVGVANNKVVALTKKGGELALKKFNERMNNRLPGDIKKVDTYIDNILLGVSGLFTEQGAKLSAEKLLATSNIKAKIVPQFLRDLLAEVVGTTDSNEGLHRLLSQVKYIVAHARQRLRDELPGHVRGKFAKPMSKQFWTTAYRSIGRSDAQSLLSTRTMAQLEQLYATDSVRTAEISKLEAELNAMQHGADYINHTKALAEYMITGQAPPHIEFLYRNARAISLLPHLTVVKKDRAAAEPIIDQLASLYAIESLSPAARYETAQGFKDKAGMEYLLTYLQDLTAREQDKTDLQNMNRWKGYVPTSFDPRKRLRLADAIEGRKLEKLGFTKVADYNGDATDVRGLAYYTTTVGASAVYNQGAMLTTETSVQGVDYLTGRTLDPTMGSMITHGPTVARITRQKRAGRAVGGLNLLPVFDTAGEIVAYERPLSAALQAKHLGQVDDLSESLGRWEGRIVEEGLARIYNEKVADQLRVIWDRDKATRADEFVVLNEAEDNRTSGAWGVLPRHIQEYLKREFGDLDGKVMVRRDMLNAAVGYRSASVGDLFTGNSDLNDDVRKGMEAVALGLMGKNAYKYLVTGERIIQGAVSTAKDLIVVRSLTVGFANALANQFQLLMHGISPIKAAKIQATALNEVTAYRRNIVKIAELNADLVVEKDQGKRNKLERLRDSLTDANSKMMIYPLIQAGELPSISEGLDEQDEFSITKDFTGWLEKQAAKFPPGVVEAAKWAVIAKDTPLYQGMNRFIQYGDFVAKVALYQHMTSQGSTPKEALREISEEFVNYALLPGRSRTYWESMGMTWFLNYKIRIQKIMLRNIRRNPLRALMVGGGAGLMGLEQLYEAVPWEISYSSLFGPGQLFRSGEAIMWNQLFN